MQAFVGWELPNGTTISNGRACLWAAVSLVLFAFCWAIGVSIAVVLQFRLVGTSVVAARTQRSHVRRDSHEKSRQQNTPHPVQGSRSQH
jgi:hypothetical protein